MARGISDVLSIYLDPKPVSNEPPPQSGGEVSARSEPRVETESLGAQRSDGERSSPRTTPRTPPSLVRQLAVPLDPQDLLEPVLTWNLAAALHRQGYQTQLTPYWVDPSTPRDSAPSEPAILLWLHASAPGLARAQRRLEGADPYSTIDTIVYGTTDPTSAPTWHRRLRLDRREHGASSPKPEMRCRGALCGGVEIARSLVRGRSVLHLDPDGVVARSLLALAERVADPALEAHGDT